MNKFGVTAILVAALVCLVSAAPSSTGKGVESEVSIESGSKLGYGPFKHGHKLPHRPHHEYEPEEFEHYGHKNHGHRSVHGHRDSNDFNGYHDDSEFQNGHHEFETHGKESNNFKKVGHKHGGFKGHHDSFGFDEEECCEEYPRFEHQGHGHQSHKHHGQGHLVHKQHGHKEHGHQGHLGHKHQGHHFELPETHEHSENLGHQGHQGHLGNQGQNGHQGHQSQHGHEGHQHGGKGAFSARQGSATAFEDRESSKGSLGLQDDERERVHAEGTKVGSKTLAKGVAAGHANKNHKVDTGLHKHQQFKTDKTIIKDNSTGSNDIKINRRVQDSKDNGILTAGSIGTENELTNNRVDAERERDRNLEANNAAFREKDLASAEFNEF